MNYYKNHGTRIKAKCYGYEIKKWKQSNQYKTSLKVLLKYYFNGEEVISSLGVLNNQYKYKIGEEIPIMVLTNKGADYIAIESTNYKIVQYIFGLAAVATLTWGTYLTIKLKNFELFNWIQLGFCLYGGFILIKIYKKVKPDLKDKILKSTNIETEETLSDPIRKLILSSEDISTKNLFNYKIGLLITMIFFLGTNGLIYSLWDKASNKLRETIISSIQDMDFGYFIIEFQDKNPFFYILSFLLLMDIFMLISLFIQLQSRQKNGS